MIKPDEFCALLAQQNIDFFCGVPDSLLKPLCAYIDDVFPLEKHVITANEGNAIGMAAGRYLGSGHAAAVYLQNSGLGNIINPLTSLADREVYSIPMLLIIGWRGEPGIKDEPQHVKQGAITESQLNLLDIPYAVIDSAAELDDVLSPLLETMEQESRPVALLVRKNTFAAYKSKPNQTIEFRLPREEALKVILGMLGPQDLVVSTTGKTSREVFETRQLRSQETTDFLTVGAMGHTSSIAFGVASASPGKRVIALDGDGAMLMHMGALPIIGNHSAPNLVHVVLNNQSHESVGGQPTVAGNIDIEMIAKASGYRDYLSADSEVTLNKAWKTLSDIAGPVMLEVKIAQGSRDNLGRPTTTPIQNKQAFMRHAGSAK